jgi:drug/metabolite transporter (DMT)-like permease
LGLKWAPSINVHVISSLGPIVLYVLSLIWLKEKAHPQIMKGMIIALVGVMIIIFAPIVMGNGLDHNAVTYSSGLVLLGNIFFVISMIGNVFHTLYNKRALKHVNPYIVTCVGFLAGSVIFVPFMWQELQTWSLDQVGFHGWIGILYGLFLSSALAYFLHNFAVAKMKAQEVGVFTYIEPIVAVLVAIPLVGERPDLFFIIGSVLVFGGIYWSQQHPHYKAVNKKLSR